MFSFQYSLCVKYKYHSVNYPWQEIQQNVQYTTASGLNVLQARVGKTDNREAGNRVKRRKKTDGLRRLASLGAWKSFIDLSIKTDRVIDD